MPRIADGSSPRRARRRSVSRRLGPQSTSTQVPSASTASALPPLPLARDAKRSNLLQLVVQQREDALRAFRRFRRAVLAEDVDAARGARFAHLDRVLLGVELASGAEHAVEEALLVDVGLRVGIAHEVDALLPVPVLDREADAVEREADPAPGAVERLEHLEQLAARALGDACPLLGG